MVIRYTLSSYQTTRLLELINTKSVKNICKYLIVRLSNTGGRSDGSIVTPRRGNFARTLYRLVDFKRSILPEYSSIIIKGIYSSISSANYMAACFPMGLLTLILQIAKVSIGAIIKNNTEEPTEPGDSSSLSNISSGKLIHCIDGKFTRAAGSSTTFVRIEEDNAQALVKLKSGELRFFHISTIATLGAVGNENHFLRHYKHAGVIRHLGRRPRTRPSAMNPVDHPMGGRTRGGAQPTNKKGRITLNRKTVKHHSPNILYTVRQIKLRKR